MDVAAPALPAPPAPRKPQPEPEPAPEPESELEPEPDRVFGECEENEDCCLTELGVGCFFPRLNVLGVKLCIAPTDAYVRPRKPTRRWPRPAGHAAIGIRGGHSRRRNVR